MHSLGSRLLGKVTSAHSGAGGFHRGGSRCCPPPSRPRRGEGARGWTARRGPGRGLRNPRRLAGRGAAGKAWCAEGFAWDLNPRPQVPSGARVGLGGKHQAREAAPQKRNPCSEPGVPRYPVSLPLHLHWRGALCMGQSPKGLQPSWGLPSPPPCSPGPPAASPPPVWYLHLSHICKLLSCPRLVTAEPSATDLAPLIFPPKSILHFPLIIPWLLSELSLLPRLLQPMPVSLERLPFQPKTGVPRARWTFGEVGWISSAAGPSAWEPGQGGQTHSPPSGKHSTLNPPGRLCPPPAFPPPFTWDGSKTLSLHHDLQKKNKITPKTALGPPVHGSGCPHPLCPAALRRWHCQGEPGRARKH